ncbi:hypothetical protein KI387_025586, partial [Taxus chinensis]
MADSNSRTPAVKDEDQELINLSEVFSVNSEVDIVDESSPTPEWKLPKKSYSE